MKSIALFLVATILFIGLSCKKSGNKSELLTESESVEIKDTLKFVPQDTSRTVNATPCESNIDTLNAIYLADLGTCFPSIGKLQQGYIIDDKVYFDKVADSVRSIYKYAPCDAEIFPKIDFNKYTLLGLITCGYPTTQNDKQVISDVCNKQYIYTIIQKNPKGFNFSLAVFSLNWALVPKLPNGYSVCFNVKEK